MSEWDRQYHERYGQAGRPGTFGSGTYNRDQYQSGRAAAQWRNDSRRDAIGAVNRLVGAHENVEARARARVPLRQRLARSALSDAIAAGTNLGDLRGGGAAANFAVAGNQGLLASMRERIAGEKEVDQASIGAAQAAYEGAKEIRSMSDTSQEYSEGIALGTKLIEEAITANKSWMGDDEDAINRAIRSVVAQIRVSSPRAADELERMYPAATKKWHGFTTRTDW